MKFEALNWRERLSRVVELERRCGNARMVKAVQAMMGRLSDAELTLRRVQHPDEEVLCADEIYWLIAMYPISRR